MHVSKQLYVINIGHLSGEFPDSKLAMPMNISEYLLFFPKLKLLLLKQMFQVLNFTLSQHLNCSFLSITLQKWNWWFLNSSILLYSKIRKTSLLNQKILFSISILEVFLTLINRIFRMNFRFYCLIISCHCILCRFLILILWNEFIIIKASWVSFSLQRTLKHLWITPIIAIQISNMFSLHLNWPFNNSWQFGISLNSKRNSFFARRIKLSLHRLFFKNNFLRLTLKTPSPEVTDLISFTLNIWFICLDNSIFLKSLELIGSIFHIWIRLNVFASYRKLMSRIRLVHHGYAISYFTKFHQNLIAFKTFLWFWLLRLRFSIFMITVFMPINRFMFAFTI